MNKIEEKVKAARFPVVLTGAGISAPSGIPTFQDGTWKGRPIRDFLSRWVFDEYPVEFYELFIEMVGWCQKPVNAAHLKLAEWGVPVITQNIDGLHTRAGSKNVLELHGSLSRVICRYCGKTISSEEFVNTIRPAYESGDNEAKLQAITCECGCIYDTDIVLYGDRVHSIDQAYDLVEQCDLMLVVGTSLEVNPAASLPQIAWSHSAEIIMVNEDCVRELAADNAGETMSFNEEDLPTMSSCDIIY